MRSVAQIIVNRKSFVRILALCAMKEETDHLRKQLEYNNFLLTPDDMLFRNGLIVNVKTTGIGMVNSAANSSLHIRDMKPDIVINVGCAGAHIPSLEKGDVVVCESQVGTTSVIAKEYETLPYGDRELSQPLFFSDETLIGMARKSGAELIKWNNARRYPLITTGRVASSDTWTDSAAGVEKLHKLFGTLCEDMEASAIAHVSAANGIPFLSVKDVSNSVFLEQSTDTFDAVEHSVPHLAGMNAASVAAKTLRDLSFMTG
ncbi:MAG: hypothetical protein CBC12_07285 [Candidatus Puniceispirillum sp. TMED52]|jgi:adenosylhomocysteine nucleosidase|nr:MAG: hypothetical protein CBC12_07285 [Candidatus Puniceispirillum sp. TMED52]RPF82007.1 MAG: 5'-methylthioadenosine/S-adenosylhomocysteine nucleosidase [Rhodothermaceae bacterium TMED105]|tara:strand:+ start:2818 stop:3597 length:780 start_codon:yes stop_codon:yes gene_type:complete